MATALPVLQAFDAATYTVSGAAAYGPSIPYTSFTTGHRYLIFASLEIRSYDGKHVRASLRYNNNSLYGVNRPVRAESTKFVLAQFMDRVMITDPSGYPYGLQLWAESILSGGGEIRNIRLVAIDLDVSNTDFPQDSANGWLWAENNATVALTTTYAPYASKMFTPDGDSDYLIIGCGTIDNVSSTHPHLGIGIDKSTAIDCYTYATMDAWAEYILMSSMVVRFPNAPVNVSVNAYVTNLSARITATKLLILRLKTFTKQAGTHVSNPVVSSGTSWQTAASVSPVPTPVAGDKFLVFSAIKAIFYSADTNTFSEQVLRNPGATQIEISTTADHRAANDFIGPSICLLDTADGANSYTQQFKRNDSGDYPQYFYYSTLAALKAEVGYTAPTKTYLPVITKMDAGPYTLTATETVYMTIPGYKFLSGHRYLVLAYAEVETKNNQASCVKLQFNGTNLPSVAQPQDQLMRQSAVFAFSSMQLMERITTATGTGVGLTLVAWRGVQTDPRRIRNLRLVAIDLDVNNTDFPQNDANGWLWAENNTGVALTTTRTPHSSVTFTPDGDSDYLVIGVGQMTAEAAYGYGGVGIDVPGGAEYLAYLYHYTSSSWYSYCNMLVLRKPAALPTKVSFDAYVASSTGYIYRSRVLVLRLKTFVKQASAFVVTPTFTTPSTAWQSIAAATPSPAPVAGDQFLIFSRYQAYAWGQSENYVNKRILRDAVALDSQQTALIGATSDFFGPTTAWLDTATGANNYSLEFQRVTDGNYPANFYYVCLAAVSTEVKYTGPDPSIKRVPSAMVARYGSVTDLPASPSWKIYATVPGYKFVAGRRYLALATFSQFTGGVTAYYSSGQLIFNDSTIVGTSQESNNSNAWKMSFIVGRVTGTGGGSGLQLRGQCHALNSGGQLRDIRLVIIDLDAHPSAFPEGDAGWKYVENLVSATNPVSPTWLTHSTLTFTPDGTSDYLVLAEVELYNAASQFTDVSKVRLLNDTTELEPPLEYYDGTTVGQSACLDIVTPMVAPAATPVVLNLQAQRATSNSYPAIRRSCIFVIRLGCFEFSKVEFTAGDQQNANAYPTWLTLESGILPGTPSADESHILLARTVGRSGGSSRMNYRLRNTVIPGDAYAPQEVRYGSHASNRFPNTLAVIQTPTVNPTYNFDEQNVAGYPTSPIYSHTALMILGLLLKTSSFEDATALGTLLLSGSATPALIREVMSAGAVALGGNAAPVRLVHPLALGGIELFGSAGVERLLNPNLIGSISVLGVAHGFTAEGLPLPSVARAFLDEEELGPSEMFELGVWGDDTPAVKNRLKVIGSTQLAIDAAYVPTGGVGYTFKGPASGVTNPLQLGFKRGDKIYLFQAQGEPAGLNVGKVLTIFDPATLEVMEALTYPDGAAVYKFFAVRRGAR